jgi:septum formation protein
MCYGFRKNGFVMQIILGSSSPRRREILSYFSLPFVQISPSLDEEAELFTGDPAHYAKNLAEKKAALLAAQFPNDLILTADTVVYCHGKLYNKPRDETEGFRFLTELAGNWHQVFSGVCAVRGSKFASGVEETKILFHSLTSEQIRLYHRHFNFTDKAGGYAIQNGGGLVVKRIEGCYYNVMGLPLNTMKEVLLKMGIDIWKYLKAANTK